MKKIMRKSIIRDVKRKLKTLPKPKTVGELETLQDKLIEEECISRGYALIHFYACDGIELNMLLNSL